MQERGMCRINPDLDRLQIIAFQKALEGKDMGVWRLQAIDCGKRRRIAGPKIGENHAIPLDTGIVCLAEMADPVVLRQFARLVEAGAVRREKPAMKGTAQPV